MRFAITIAVFAALGSAISGRFDGPDAPVRAESATSAPAVEPVAPPAAPHPPLVATRPAVELPPLPEGVEELKFADFFRSPVGPRGLEYTDRIRELDGKRVRILGYMARRNSLQWGRLLLASIPVQMHDTEYGLADDLPPATLLVELPGTMKTVVPHTPGVLLLTGVLRLGTFELPEARTCYVKLELDPPTPSRPAERGSAAAGGDTTNRPTTRPAEINAALRDEGSKPRTP